MCCDCAQHCSSAERDFEQASGKFSEVELTAFLIKTMATLLNGCFMFHEGKSVCLAGLQFFMVFSVFIEFIQPAENGS